MCGPTFGVHACFDSLDLSRALAKRTADLRAYQFSVWSSFTGDPHVADVSVEILRKFQSKAVAKGYAAESIETILNAVMTVLRACLDAGWIERMPVRPKRLTGKPTKFTRLSLAEFNQFLGGIPAGIVGTRGRSVDWWRGWWGLLYFSAIRLADALALERAHVGADGIEVRQTKTGGLVRIPMHAVCRRLIEAGEKTGRIFPLGRKTLYRITHRICVASGVKLVTPQMVRVLSARQYERAHPGSGRIILGRGFPGADRYYFDTHEILQSASERLEIPDALLTDGERRDMASAEFNMLAEFRRLATEQRQAVLTIARSMRRA